MNAHDNDPSPSNASVRLRRIVIGLPWVTLPLTGYLVVTGASSFVVWGTFFFPIAIYLVTLNIVEPWLDRRADRRTAA